MGRAVDIPPRAVEDRAVQLEVPARADYVLLARLALSAVARLTELADEDVADLKLAITEAAATFVGASDPDAAGAPLRPVSTDDGAALRFAFTVTDTGLVVDVECDRSDDIREQDRELSLAIIDATVDEREAAPGAIRLFKRPGHSGG